MKAVDANSNMDWWLGGADRAETHWSGRNRMGQWPESELGRMAQADDLRISPFREDGVTYGTPTWIWSVVVDEALYVRAYNGTASRWYQAAVQQKSGRISIAGMTKNVAFEQINGTLNDRIDDAYRAKYGRSPYLNAMIGPRARSATIEVKPTATTTTNRIS